MTLTGKILATLMRDHDSISSVNISKHMSHIQGGMGSFRFKRAFLCIYTLHSIQRAMEAIITVLTYSTGICNATPSVNEFKVPAMN